ncbi:hypothetical protein BKA64DRAFT_22973 [Cadophora sp. MPI-SDFR-AT-0126]|nr:hypothetical protein BKA64DRAFT_22973 [Leotiomycetes sp. MPI-SDFR-AT-0126]
MVQLPRQALETTKKYISQAMNRFWGKSFNSKSTVQQFRYHCLSSFNSTQTKWSPSQPPSHPPSWPSSSPTSMLLLLSSRPVPTSALPLLCTKKAAPRSASTPSPTIPSSRLVYSVQGKEMSTRSATPMFPSIVLLSTMFKIPREAAVVSLLTLDDLEEEYCLQKLVEAYSSPVCFPGTQVGLSGSVGCTESLGANSFYLYCEKNDGA